MAESVGQIGLDLVVNRNSFDRQMNGIQKLARKAGAGLAVAFGTKKLIDFSKSCISLGSNLQEVQNVVDVTFPKMNRAIDKFAQNAATKFGLSETMAKKYSGTFGAMSRSFGFGEKEAASMATTLTGLAGDLASFYNISQDEAYTKLKSVFTGETETLKDLGVVMTQSALDSYALANGFGKTTKSMSEAEKVALRYQFVQSKLSAAQGDFARTSGSWANQVRILTLQFESLKAVIGQGMIKAFTPVIRVVNILLGKLLALSRTMGAVFGGSSNKGAKKTEKTTKKIGGAASGISTAFGSANKSASKLGKTTDKVAKKAKNASKKLRSLMGFDQVNKVDKPEKTGSGGSGGSGGAGAGGIGGSVPVMDFDTGGYGNVQEKGTKLGKLFDNLKNSAGRLKVSFKEFTDLLKGGFKWTYDNILKPFGKWTVSKLAPKALDVLSGAFKVLTSVGKALQPLWQWLWDKLFSKMAKFAGTAIIKALDLLAGGLNKLSVWIDKHQTTVQNIAIALTSFFGAFKLVKWITKFSGTMSNALSGIKMFSKGIISFKTLFSGLFPKVFAKAGKALKFFTSPVGIAIVVIAGLVTAGILLWKNWDKIKKKLKPFAAFFKKTWEGIQKSFKKIVDGIVKKVDEIKKIPEKLKNVFKEKIEGVEEWFSGISDGFKNTLSKLGENIPDMSEIAENISDSIGEVKAKVTAYFADKKEELTSKWNNLTENVKEKVADLKARVAQKWNDLKAAWSNIVDNVKEKVADMKAKVASRWSDLQNAWNGVVGNIKDKTADMKAKIASSWGSLKDSWNSIVNNIKDKTADMKVRIASKWSDFKSKWKNLLGNFKGKTVGIGLKITAKVNDMKKWFNSNVISRVNKAIHKVPFMKKVNIPYLAEGGYVKKNTPQLAMIGDNRHQGEVTAPEGKLQEMANRAAQMAGGNDNAEIIALLKQLIALVAAIDPSVYLDGRKVTDMVVKNINARTKATGVCEIII